MNKKLKILTVLSVLMLPLIACNGNNVSENSDEPSSSVHEHSFHEEFEHDDTNHWHECDCGEKSGLVAHSFEHEVITPATCESKGVERLTCECGFSKTQDIDPLGHDLEQSNLVEPTTEQEGSVTLSCKRDGCDYQETKKILKLPSFSLSGATLSWSEIDNALGYMLTLNNVEQDVGGITSYTLSQSDINLSSLAVRAYPDENDSEYVDYDAKKNQVVLSKGATNIQENFNSDFEDEVAKYTVGNTNGWSLYPYGNWSNAPYYVVQEDDGNMCGMIPATTWWPNCTKLQKDMSNATCAPGDYRLSFDIKLSQGANDYFETDAGGERYGHLYIHLWTGLEVEFPISDERNNIKKGNTETWTTISYDYTLDKQYGSFMHICMIYWPEHSLENNYVLVDNIQIKKLEEGNPVGDNLDTIVGGDFENWNPNGVVDTWIAGGTILFERSAAGSSVIKEENNQAVKIYGESDYSAFNFAGNYNELGKAGLFEMSFKLKKGSSLKANPEFSTAMWGWANGGNAVNLMETTYIDISSAKVDEYTTYTLRFLSKGLANCDQVNIYFNIGLDNLTGKDTNKYIVMDDLCIYPLTLA